MTLGAAGDIASDETLSFFKCGHQSPNECSPRPLNRFDFKLSESGEEGWQMWEPSLRPQNDLRSIYSVTSRHVKEVQRFRLRISGWVRKTDIS